MKHINTQINSTDSQVMQFRFDDGIVVKLVSPHGEYITLAEGFLNARKQYNVVVSQLEQLEEYNASLAN